MKIDERLLAYKPISVTLNFDWDKMTYDERVLARHNYIEEQKKKDPNYIGYDFVEHFSSTYGGKLQKIVYTLDFSKLVNTIGQVVRILYNEVFITFGGDPSRKYKSINMRIKNKTSKFTVHRIVASTFIPIPEKLKEIRDKLVINHKNDDARCNFRSNLEWCTNQENIKKAVETGAKPSSAFKFTITRPGPYFGNEYYFNNMGSLEENGFANAGVYAYLNNSAGYLCGTWEIVPREELKDKEIGVSRDVFDYIKDRKYGSINAVGWVGTIISEGPCKGQRFVIYGYAQITSLGFNSSNISNCVAGRVKVHRNCVWEKISTTKLPDVSIGLTEEQKKHIFG